MKNFKYSSIFIVLIVFFVFQTTSFADPLWDDPGLPDTVFFEGIDYYLDDSLYGGKLKVPVFFFNDEGLMSITVPLAWSGIVILDSSSFAGSRVEEADYKAVHIDSAGGKVLLAVVMNIDPIPSGRGLLNTLYFSILDTGYLNIDTAFFPPANILSFCGYHAPWIPQFVDLQLNLIPSAAGDVNQDGSADVIDVVFMINYLFRNGPPPCCSNCTDVNADCEMTVSDAVYLINYLFRSGTPPQVGCVLPF